ncbi:hypothetical protein AB1N83_009100 [Pleurotus pulmonarius]
MDIDGDDEGEVMEDVNGIDNDEHSVPAPESVLDESSEGQLEVDGDEDDSGYYEPDAHGAVEPDLHQIDQELEEEPEPPTSTKKKKAVKPIRGTVRAAIAVHHGHALDSASGSLGGRYYRDRKLIGMDDFEGVASTTAGAKRKAQAVGPQELALTVGGTGKRPKGLGGLVANWKAPIQPPRHASTTDSSALTPASGALEDETAELEEDYTQGPGEFDGDEPVETLAAVRARKKQIGTIMPVAEADSAPVRRTTQQMGLQVRPKQKSVARSRPTGHRAMSNGASESVKTESTVSVANGNGGTGGRVTYIVRDLPFPQGQSHIYNKKWKTMKATAITWSGTIKDAFGASSDPGFETMVSQMWLSQVPSLAEHANSKIVHSVIQSVISDYRSQVGKVAVATFAKLIGAGAEPSKVEEIKKEYSPPRFIYRDVSEDGHLEGSFLSPLLLEVFAVYAANFRNAAMAYGDPVGALALACAAIERAMDGWRGGRNVITEGAKRDANSGPGDDPAADAKDLWFSHDNWGGTIMYWADEIESKVTPRRWDMILQGAANFLSKKSLLSAQTDDLKPFGENARQPLNVSDDDTL